MLEEVYEQMGMMPTGSQPGRSNKGWETVLEINKARKFWIMVTERAARKEFGYCVKGRGMLRYWSCATGDCDHTQIPAGSMVYLMMKVVDQKV